jgi:hypothetical protein
MQRNYFNSCITKFLEIGETYSDSKLQLRLEGHHSKTQVKV